MMMMNREQGRGEMQRRIARYMEGGEERNRRKVQGRMNEVKSGKI